MLTRLSVVTVCLSSLAWPVLAETPPIEKIAPENTVMLLGARHAGRSFESLKRTPLWAMWESEKMGTMRAEFMKEMDEGIEEMLKELGVEEDSLQPPSGPVGVAMFTVLDPDLGTPQMAVLAIGDWGENAEKTDALIRAALDKGKEQEQIDYEEQDVAGHTVLAIDLSKLQVADRDGGGGMGMPMPDPEEMISGMTTMHYVRDGGTIMLCSDLTALTEALEIAGGKSEGTKFSQRPDYQDAMSLAGSENDAYGVLLTRDVMDLMGGQEAAGMMMMVRPIVRSLVGEVAAYSAGMRLDAQGAIVEQTVGVYMPRGKKGLTALVDKPAARSEVPAFAGADALSISSVNFDFAGLMEVIRTVVTSNPMLQAQAGEALPMIEQSMGPIFAALGGRMDIVGLSAGGEASHTITAIECKNPQGFENAFSAFAAEAGMEPRDFLGQRIYTLDVETMGMMMPMGGPADDVSLGIGGGHVYIGATPGVEQALRAGGAGAGAGLSREAAFQRAVALLGNEPVVAWGYSDTVASFTSSIEAQEKMTRAAIEDMKEWDPEAAAEMEKDLANSPLSQFDEAFLRQYIGPSSWKVVSNEKGFVMRSYLLPPVK